MRPSSMGLSARVVALEKRADELSLEVEALDLDDPAQLERSIALAHEAVSCLVDRNRLLRDADEREDLSDE